jgi:hypothetical protein
VTYCARESAGGAACDAGILPAVRATGGFRMIGRSAGIARGRIGSVRQNLPRNPRRRGVAHLLGNAGFACVNCVNSVTALSGNDLHRRSDKFCVTLCVTRCVTGAGRPIIARGFGWCNSSLRSWSVRAWWDEHSVALGVACAARARAGAPTMPTRSEGKATSSVDSQVEQRIVPLKTNIRCSDGAGKILDRKAKSTPRSERVQQICARRGHERFARSTAME